MVTMTESEVGVLVYFAAEKMAAQSQMLTNTTAEYSFNFLFKISSITTTQMLLVSQVSLER